jgi:hypothetical protein
MQTLRIFISSPGDVADERQIAGKVIERLQGKYWSFVRLDDVFWEQKVIRSTAHYQDELVNPGDCEMVVGILWSRLGSLMPEKFRKASGERFDSGTEWELEMAFEAYGNSLELTGDPVAAKPDIVVYRRNQPPPQVADPEQETQAAAQVARLGTYFQENYWFPDGTIKRPITNYTTLAEFETVLSRNLEELILRQIPGLKPGFEPPPISGSPFKGLQAFDFSDSDRYFGRNREIREIQQRLVTNAGKGLPFVLIYGGSGYGKSSLMRAGLAPVLTRPGGSIDEIQGWRRVPFQPARGDGTLCERLARALCLPPTPEESENCRLHRHWPLTGLAEISGSSQNPVWDIASLTRHFADDDKRVFAIAAIVESLESLNRHLLLEIDQLEEIFTVSGIDDAQRTAFLRTIGDLCLSGRVWTVATMRSEFFPRVAEQPALLDLVGKDRGYILPPPDRQSLREIIRYPALAARLDFERRIQEIEIAGEKAKHEFLHDQILADAESSPDALPLLEFTLQQLYEEKRDTLLTWDAYAKAGGLKGAIAQRATRVYQTLPPTAREARHRIFAALIHIDPNRGTVTRQRAPLDSLKSTAGSESFLNAFLEAHLLVTDEDALTHQPVVTLAHEALISHWDELATWIKDHQGDLLARQRLAEQTNLWQQNARKKSYLLSEARLAEAERVSERELFTLILDETTFLKMSRQRSRTRTRILQAAVAIFALVAVTAVGFGLIAREKTKLANKQTKRAVLGEGEAEKQRTFAEQEAEKARKLNHEASLKSYGRAIEAFEVQKDSGTGLANLAEALRYDPTNRAAREYALSRLASLPVSSMLPILNPLLHKDSVNHGAFSPDGSRFVTLAGRYQCLIQAWDATTGIAIGAVIEYDGEFDHIAFSQDGTCVVATGNSGCARWNLSSGELLREPRPHDSGSSIAYSPDGTRVVTRGPDNNTAQIWDVASGRKIGEPLQTTDWIECAVFSRDGTLVVIVSKDRTAQLLDTATGARQGVPIRHDSDIIDAAFSPGGRLLATSCGDHSIHLWNAITCEPVGVPLRHTEYITSIAFSPEGTRIISTSNDKSARIWSSTTGDLLCAP